MKTGDKFIWDSGFGFEVVRFFEPACPGSCIVMFETGILIGNYGSVSIDEMTPYSDKLKVKFERKYKTKK